MRGYTYIYTYIRISEIPSVQQTVISFKDRESFNLQVSGIVMLITEIINYVEIFVIFASAI